MKEQTIKERFLVLRAQGQSFEKIAKQLKVSKQTLINWSREFRYEISNMRACRLEELQEKYLIVKEKRIALFGERLKAIEKELCERDLSDVPTAKLYELLARYAGALKAEAEPLGFVGEADIRYQKEFDALFQKL